MIRVAMLVFPGVQSLDVFGPLDVFAEANRFLLPEQHYAVEVIGTTDGPFSCSNGVSVVPHRHYVEAGGPVDLLLVAGGPELPFRSADPGVCEWLVRSSAQARRYGSICNGAFLLGHAGLLDGKTVTTHWSDAATLARKFPTVQVDSNRIYSRDGNLYTSAGVTAGIDLALYLVTEDHGSEVSLNVAKRLVVFTQRSGGQSQFSPYLIPHAGEESPISAVQHYVLGHLCENLDVETLAGIVSMSPRTFARVFAKETNATPAQFVESARIDAARVLLDQSDEPLKTIAFRCGFGDANRMRQAFIRRLGLSARQYRENFRKVS